MKIVIAPDSFKESLDALAVAKAIEAGFKRVFPHAQYDLIPMADGGEGTVQSLVDATQGRIERVSVTGRWANACGLFSAYRVMAKQRLSKCRRLQGCILYLSRNEIH